MRSFSSFSAPSAAPLREPNATYRNLALYPCVQVVVEPQADPILLLQVSEDDIDGLDHHLLLGRHDGR